jgi:hypothetical protein
MDGRATGGGWSFRRRGGVSVEGNNDIAVGEVTPARSVREE